MQRPTWRSERANDFRHAPNASICAMQRSYVHTAHYTVHVATVHMCTLQRLAWSTATNTLARPCNGSATSRPACICWQHGPLSLPAKCFIPTHMLYKQAWDQSARIIAAEQTVAQASLNLSELELEHISLRIYSQALNNTLC